MVPVEFLEVQQSFQIGSTKKLHAATLVSHRVLVRSFSSSETDAKVKRPTPKFVTQRRQRQPSQARFVERNLSLDELKKRWSEAKHRPSSEDKRTKSKLRNRLRLIDNVRLPIL